MPGVTSPTGIERISLVTLETGNHGCDHFVLHDPVRGLAGECRESQTTLAAGADPCYRFRIGDPAPLQPNDSEKVKPPRNAKTQEVAKK